MTVTRTERAKSGAFPFTADPFRDVFCDWVTVYQDHPSGFCFDPPEGVHGPKKPLPVFNGGYAVSFEPDALTYGVDFSTGERILTFDATKAEYTTHKRITHEGSYETACQIRCDGYRVEFSGNPSRFGRSDNLFGYGVVEAVDKASTIVKALGLPGFTDQDASHWFARSDSHIKTNAVITRIDLTSNFATGGKQEAYLILDSFLGQGTKRGANPPKYYKNGISWNEGSRRHYEKLYYKAAELGKHCTEAVKDYCEEHGILRFEASIKARELADRNLQRIVDWAKVIRGQRMDNVIFGKFAEVLHRQDSTESLEVSDIPGKFQMVAQAYLDGRDPYRTMTHSQRTRQRWRSALIDYGLDIALPRNIVRMETRTRLLDLHPLARPDWYGVAA